MGCKSSRAIDGIRAARRQETNRLVRELRSVGVPSWTPPALILDESSLVGTPDLKEAISKDPDLLSAINNHLDLATKTLRSVTGVKGRVDEVRVNLSAVLGALERFEENDKKKKKKKKKKSTKKYSEAVDKLKELRLVGDQFAKLNIDELRSAFELSQLAELHRRDQELEKRLRSFRKRREVWGVMYIAGIVAVLACSVVLTAVTSPVAIAGATAIATAIAGATATASAMKAVEPLIHSVWHRREAPLRGEKDVTAAMLKTAELAVHGLDNVRLTFEKFKIDFGAVLDYVGFAISREDEDEMAVKMGIEHIMAKKGEVDKGIDSLKEMLDLLDAEIRKAATEFLKTIMKDI